jgi:hypothetical protein
LHPPVSPCWSRSWSLASRSSLSRAPRCGGDGISPCKREGRRQQAHMDMVCGGSEHAVQCSAVQLQAWSWRRGGGVGCVCVGGGDEVGRYPTTPGWHCHWKSLTQKAQSCQPGSQEADARKYIDKATRSANEALSEAVMLGPGPHTPPPPQSPPLPDLPPP